MAGGGRGEVAGRAGRDIAKIRSSSNIYAKPGLGDGYFASTIPSGLAPRAETPPIVSGFNSYRVSFVLVT